MLQSLILTKSIPEKKILSKFNKKKKFLFLDKKEMTSMFVRRNAGKLELKTNLKFH